MNYVIDTTLWSVAAIDALGNFGRFIQDAVYISMHSTSSYIFAAFQVFVQKSAASFHVVYGVKHSHVNHRFISVLMRYL